MESRSEKSATADAPHSLQDAGDLAGNLCQRREFLRERLTCRRSRNADNWNHPAERGLIARSHPGPGILGRMHHELAVRGLYGRLFPRYHVTGAGAAKHNAVDAQVSAAEQELIWKLEKAGYTQVRDLKSTAEGIVAKAMKDGKEVSLVVDSSGTFRER